MAGASDSSKDQDRCLPIANISRIMKKSLPANAKISKEAKETVQECASEFISFVTGEASDKCQREKRKTINGDDLLWAMTTLGFEDYVGPLKAYLSKYRESEGEKSGDQDGEKFTAKEPGFLQGFNSGDNYQYNGDHAVIVHGEGGFQFGSFMGTVRKPWQQLIFHILELSGELHK